SSKIVAPDAVNEGACEELVVRGAQPVHQGDAGILAGLGRDHRPTQGLGRQRLIGFRMRQGPVRRTLPLAAAAHGADVYFADLGKPLVAALLPRIPLLVGLVNRSLGVRRGANTDLGEDVGIGAVIDLRPAVERMLVTLGAFDSNAEKRGCGLLTP